MYAGRASMTFSGSGVAADFDLEIGSALRQLRRQQLTLVDLEKIVAPLFRGWREHPRAGKSATADLSDPIVVTLERRDSIRQRRLVIRITGETETVPHDLLADQ